MSTGPLPEVAAELEARAGRVGPADRGGRDRLRRLGKAAANCMDYDDLLLQWGRLIREFPDQPHRMQGGIFRHLLIDEMQDTNAVQVAVVELGPRRPKRGQPHRRRRRRSIDLPIPRGGLR